MSIKITVDYQKALAGFEKIKKQLRPEVINKSLDPTLTIDLAKLKLKLFNMLNNDQKSKVEIKNQALGETQVTIKKSDQEVIKHLTGIDIDKVSMNKDNNTLADGKVAVISNKTIRATLDKRTGTSLTGLKMPSGVNLRISMNEIDSFDSQQARAENYFNEAVYVFVDANGKSNYYKNPGIDMKSYIKVVCSKDSGKTGPSEQRWNTGTSNRGFADWTLLTEGVDRIKRNFINITDVVDKIKEGDHEEAKSVLEKVSQRSTTTTTVASKIDNLKENKDLSPSVSSYSNIVKLIKNLKIEKTIKTDSVIYTLVSTYDETIKDYGSFQDKIGQEANLWQVSNEKHWIQAIVNSIVRLAVKSLR